VAHVLTPTNKSHAIGVCIRHEHVSYYAHIQTPWDFFGVGSHTCNPTLQLHANDWGYRIYRTHAPIPWLPCVCSQCELLLFLISFVVSFLKIRVCCVPESQCIEILTHNEHGRFNGRIIVSPGGDISGISTPESTATTWSAQASPLVNPVLIVACFPAVQARLANKG
jgi:hypothetical protein